MDWNNAGEDPSVKKGPLRRSVSSIGFNAANANTSGVREAKSFTGALQELKRPNKASPRQDPNYYINMFSEQHKDCEYITKEASSDKIFIVRHEMLNYRGKQYSLSDIAPRWKKDCRMWLWKSKRPKSMSELQEKMQSMRLPSSSDVTKRM